MSKLSKFLEFIVPYTAFGVAYLSYRISVYTLSELFNTIDEIIYTNTNPRNNVNTLLDEISDITTKHDYDTGKTILHIINTQGGQNDLIGRGAIGILTKQFKSITNFNKKIVSTLIKPIGKIIGYLLLHIPVLKRIYGHAKTAKLVIAYLIGLSSIRIIARYDYWALIFSGALPTISMDQKAILAGIRRMRMGIKSVHICLPQSNNIVEVLMNEEINVKKKSDTLINFLLLYEFLPENHLFKNPYFVCITQVLIILFISNKMGFRLALQLLLRLLKDRKISLETYREIISQLLLAGVSPIELEII